MSKMTTRQRRRKLETCGRNAFLDPDGPKAKRAGHPRYPIAKVGSCTPDRKSLTDAYRRARQQHEWAIAEKAQRIAARYGWDIGE